jgi:hypothetical protein
MHWQDTDVKEKTGEIGFYAPLKSLRSHQRILNGKTMD